MSVSILFSKFIVHTMEIQTLFILEQPLSGGHFISLSLSIIFLNLILWGHQDIKCERSRSLCSHNLSLPDNAMIGICRPSDTDLHIMVMTDIMRTCCIISGLLLGPSLGNLLWQRMGEDEQLLISISTDLYWSCVLHLLVYNIKFRNEFNFYFSVWTWWFIACNLVTDEADEWSSRSQIILITLNKR